MNRFWDSSDRLLITTVFAAIVHAVLILGVTFTMPQPDKSKSSLEITLVKSFTQSAPKEAEYRAQENQEGGGDNPEKAIPRSEPMPEPGTGQELVPAPNQARLAEIKPKDVLKQRQSEKKVMASEGIHDEAEADRPHLTADALSQQIAEVSTEINRTKDDRAHGPRTMAVNEVRAAKYQAAAYERNWQDKIEHIGTLNFPDEAARKGLSGSVLLSVGIRADGSVDRVRIEKSSGHQVLDDAAQRIVRLAAPYAPLPLEVRKETDILVITRTWKFMTDSRLETRP